MPSPDAAVRIDGLVMRYGDKTAVDHLSLSVERGTITSVLGPNGAGKTTTLETCEGYRSPHGGTVRVLGLDPVADRRALLPRIGVMLQSGGAWSGARAVEMLEHMARLHANPLPVPALVERLGLDEAGRTPYRRLSGGQQQRLALAMAVVGRPELVFVDEPTAGMDPKARRNTWDLLTELRTAGVTVVLTTHYLEEAEQLSDQVHIIDHGRLIASGSPAELTNNAHQGSLRLTTARPVSEEAVADLARALGPATSVHQASQGAPGLLATGPTDSHTLAHLARWCEDHDIVPESLSLGTQSLEDVFLELTGRELA